MNTTNHRERTLDAVKDYRYKRFTTRLLFRDLRFGTDAPGPGDSFPSFELTTTSGGQRPFAAVDPLDHVRTFRRRKFSDR